MVNTSIHFKEVINMKSDHRNEVGKAGRMVLMTVAGMTAVGGYAMDMNRTHMFNPDWTPHAKFHDAMSITLGSFLGLSGIYFLYRNTSKQDIRLGTVLPAFFWIAQGVSFTFPGAKGLEAEFPDLIPKFKGVWINEKFGAMLMLTLSGMGYAMERQAKKQESSK